jgi:predicted RecB family nuclease
MQKVGDDILFSATDLVNFLECEHLTYLDLIDLEEPLPRTPDDEEAQVFQDRGIEHERRYLQSLKDKGLHVEDLASVRGSLAEKAYAAAEAIRSGADVIYQATLLTDNFVGYPDFLRRIDPSSDKGPFRYEVVDTKLARTPKAPHIVQLSFYSELLSQFQDASPRFMRLVLGDGSEVSFRCDQYRQYYRNLKECFLAQVKTSAESSSHLDACDHCGLCRWRGLCQEKWLEEDHLNQVANITRLQMKKLRASGIHTLAQLAQHDEGKTVAKLHQQTLVKLRHQASLQWKKRVSGQDSYEILELDPECRRGLYRMPRPNVGDLFFDMEGDPLEAGGLEYLFGVYHHEGGRPQFTYFMAHTRDEERKAFEAFMDFVSERLAKHPDAHIYHYASYEEAALKRLMSFHGTRESQVDDLLRNHKLVDLYKVVRESLRTSEPAYSIKNLETFYSEKRAGEVKNAAASIVYYEKWLLTKDKQYLEEIVEYNKEDCKSTFLLREWLLKLRPHDVTWMNESDGDSRASEKPKSEVQLRREQELEAYRQKLLGDETLDPEDLALRELVFHLLSFHRRADKPEWWSIFSRRDMSTEELIDDPECIGGMTLQRILPNSSDRGADIWVYRYPDQEFKLREGEQCARTDTSDELGRIVKIDEDACLVQIQSNPRNHPPQQVSVSSGLPIQTWPLAKAIQRFADSIISRDGRYRALEAILKRSQPQIDGHEAGEPIVGPGKTDIAKIAEAVARLKESYLFIQGPPGSGKTYTGSRVIVELLRRKFRVGVSSNSHKAINNLLEHVEQRAEESGLKFWGQKKSTKDKATWFEGKFVKDVLDNKTIRNSGAPLVAGTAWLFASMDQELDFLFVDEAGQVSLANLVAMGGAARNIVLLGDQMQLGQPIQGVHPGRSGESSLEYLLDGEATISPEQGIFLETTWRMHEDVCRFISDAVYDSRLLPEPHNQNQRLLTNDLAHEHMKPTGVCFVPTDHDGCSQRSEEEASLIKNILIDILQLSYIDREGQRRRMTLENIMVVAPYNMQVNLLKRVLPKGARAGTVDKFQGQEAEVVIISMTTSSGEYLPRRIEFLYSKNRLNVAISRARILAILVSNPLLLSIKCNTIEQMELVNTLCWVKNYAFNS